MLNNNNEWRLNEVKPNELCISGLINVLAMPDKNKLAELPNELLVWFPEWSEKSNYNNNSNKFGNSIPANSAFIKLNQQLNSFKQLNWNQTEDIQFISLIWIEWNGIDDWLDWLLQFISCSLRSYCNGNIVIILLICYKFDCLPQRLIN